MLVRLISIDTMLKIFEDGWLLNKHLCMSRTEYFREYGYGDDFGGYSFPLPETIGNAGRLMKVTHSQDIRIRNEIALQFSDAQFCKLLSIRDKH